MRNQKGFALVLTLVVTALMVAVTTELIHQVYVDTSLSRGFCDGQQASLLAESGAKTGLKLLQSALSGQDYSPFITPMKQEDETGSIEITATEESGKINLNDLAGGDMDSDTGKALKRLGKQLEIPENVWGALVDWLDSDDLPGPGGAETPYYQTQKPPYSASNKKLATLAELSLVKGFTPEIIGRLRPFVTIYSAQTGSPITVININTAPKEVLIALSGRIDNSLAERIMDERRRQPFKTLGELSRVPDGGILSQELARIANVKGTVFRIVSIARVKDSSRTVEVVAQLKSGEFLSWQEY
jgi:general secretion pathway protein K